VPAVRMFSLCMTTGTTASMLRVIWSAMVVTMITVITGMSAMTGVNIGETIGGNIVITVAVMIVIGKNVLGLPCFLVTKGLVVGMEELLRR
jgi:hypothetical protein